MIESPFTIVLVELVEKRSGVLSEQLFLTHLMSSTHSNSASLAVPDQIAQSSAESLWGALEKALRAGGPVPKLNLSQLRRSWAERHPPPATSVGDIPPVSAIVIDPEPFLGLGDRNMRLHEELGDDVELHDFVPSFVRPIPPLLPISADSTELRWIDPEPLHEVLWDPAMGATGARGGEVAELMATALRSPLQEEQQQRVKAALDADPRLVFQCGLSPENLPDLVQNNSIVATEVLVRLLKSNQKDAYFDALVNMDMNQHSMAVVNRLTSTVQLPPAFVQTYVSNCIRSCGNIPDRFGQVRMVRFVCVFLQSLIKNNLIDLQDLFIEVQAFCMEHSRYVVPHTRVSLLPYRNELAEACVRRLLCAYCCGLILTRVSCIVAVLIEQRWPEFARRARCSGCSSRKTCKSRCWQTHQEMDSTLPRDRRTRGRWLGLVHRDFLSKSAAADHNGSNPRPCDKERRYESIQDDVLGTTSGRYRFEHNGIVSPAHRGSIAKRSLQAYAEGSIIPRCRPLTTRLCTLVLRSALAKPGLQYVLFGSV